jgi:hypothetical protein
MSDAMPLPLRRRDEEGEWHDLEPTPCPSCGCTVYAATDDPAMVWEPGRAWDEGCTDRSCRCHVDPVVGMVRA